MTVAELFNAVLMDGLNDLFFVADALQRHGAGWCLIGGVAVNAYTEPVVTRDCDLVVVSADLEPVLADLAAADWKIREFAFSINAQRRLGPGEDSRHRLLVQFTRPERYQPFTARAEWREVFGRDLPVACIEDLVEGKLWALSDPTRRESKHTKDWGDILRLAEAYPERVEPLLPDDLRVRSEANRALHAQAQGEDMGEEAGTGRDYPPPPGGPQEPRHGGRGR